MIFSDDGRLDPILINNIVAKMQEPKIYASLADGVLTPSVSKSAIAEDAVTCFLELIKRDVIKAVKKVQMDAISYGVECGVSKNVTVPEEHVEAFREYSVASYVAALELLFGEIKP